MGERSGGEVSRFYLTSKAISDLEGIRLYFEPIPQRYAMPVLRGLRSLIQEIGSNPLRGTIHSEATLLFGKEVRTRAMPPYRLFYRDDRGTPEIIAVIHMAQDASTVLRERFQ